MDQLKELEQTFIEEYTAAELLYSRGMLKSALVLYAKSIFASVDYLLFRKYRKLPKNHTNRFRYLRLKETQIYQILDSV